jgi:hypothetical protein
MNAVMVARRDRYAKKLGKTGLGIFARDVLSDDIEISLASSTAAVHIEKPKEARHVAAELPRTASNLEVAEAALEDIYNSKGIDIMYLRRRLAVATFIASAGSLEPQAVSGVKKSVLSQSQGPLIKKEKLQQILREAYSGIMSVDAFDALWLGVCSSSSPTSCDASGFLRSLALVCHQKTEPNDHLIHLFFVVLDLNGDRILSPLELSSIIHEYTETFQRMIAAVDTVVSELLDTFDVSMSAADFREAISADPLLTDCMGRAVPLTLRLQYGSSPKIAAAISKLHTACQYTPDALSASFIHWGAGRLDLAAFMGVLEGYLGLTSPDLGVELFKLLQQADGLCTPLDLYVSLSLPFVFHLTAVSFSHFSPIYGIGGDTEIDAEGLRQFVTFAKEQSSRLEGLLRIMSSQMQNLEGDNASITAELLSQYLQDQPWMEGVFSDLLGLS